MNTKFSIFLVSTLLACNTQAADPATILQSADRYRLSNDNSEIQSVITTFLRDGSKEKERQYLVYAQLNRQSLVVMQSPAEKGQKILMSGDDFWMILPGSQRPMRITPMQKLLGDASIGDVATLNWSQDYQAQLIGEEKCAERACLHLSLTANRKSAAYQKIELWVSKQKFQPLSADLYVQSDKLAKHAVFVLDKNQPDLIEEMILQDKLSSHKETRIRYLQRKPKTVPENWLNPMYLAKTGNLE